MRKYWHSLKRQKGFTLVELVIGLAITAAISAVMMQTIAQLFAIRTADNNRMEAVKQVENALHYINRDAQMSDNFTTTAGDFPLVLTWNEWNVNEVDLTGAHHEVTYSISYQKLERQEEITEDGILTATSRVVAYHIDDVSDCSFTDPLLTVNLTSSFDGYKPVSESRTLQVLSRPEAPVFEQ